MADYDDKSNAQSVLAVPFATVTATPTPVEIDLLDFGACTFQMFTGAGGITFTNNNRIDWKVEESDDNANWSAAGDDALILDPGAAAPGGTGIVKSYTAAKAAADANIPSVGYRGKKRWSRCTPVFVGTHATGTFVGCIARKGWSYHGPVNPLGVAIET